MRYFTKTAAMRFSLIAILHPVTGIAPHKMTDILMTLLLTFLSCFGFV